MRVPGPQTENAENFYLPNHRGNHRPLQRKLSSLFEEPLPSVQVRLNKEHLPLLNRSSDRSLSQLDLFPQKSRRNMDSLLHPQRSLIHLQKGQPTDVKTGQRNTPM